MPTPMLQARQETGRRWSRLLLIGPAFVAAIAYVDPGNVAANLTAGASYGYLLVWVLVAANAMAVLVQYQSAGPRPEPGPAELRDSLRPDSPDPAHRQPQRDGHPHRLIATEDRGLDQRDADCGSEHGPHRAHVYRPA
jgi:hypothetical protein